MATNKPPSRKTHISRIYGTNRKGERLDDMYADVERMDIVKSASQRPPDNQYQKIVRKFKWCDDPDQDGYDPKGNKNRKTEIIKVCDPESTKDVNDPDEWIPIRVIKSVKSTGGSGRGEAFQDNFLNVFINQELASGRTVKVRRVVHYDTNIDEVCQTLIDADPERREVVVPSEKYTKDLESKDKDQYVEYEIVKALKHRGNSLSVNGQFGRTKLLNQYLIDESEIAAQKIRGNNDINPPYRLDPYQNIVNINWGGLAVEFFDGDGDKFGDLKALDQKLDNLDLTHAIISLWFRIPQASIDRAKKQSAAYYDYSVFQRVIPLITWGPQPRGKIYERGGEVIYGTYPDGISRPLGTTNVVTGSHTNYMPPSYIGINIFSDGNPLPNWLEVNLQTSDHALTEATDIQTTNYFLQDDNGDGDPETVHWTVTDASFASNGEFDFFGNANIASGFGPSIGSDLADHWHHVLLSWDLSNGSSVQGSNTDSRIDLVDAVVQYSKLWCAIDDVNKNGYELPAIWIGRDTGTGDPNGMVSYTSSKYAGNPRQEGTTGGLGAHETRYDFGNPTVTLNKPKLPVSPIDIPSNLHVRQPSGTGISIDIAPTLHVELAELQIFAGISLDTSILSNRRLFIDEDGKPVNPKTAEDALGQKPAILLHRAGQWKGGKNTGSAEVDFDKIGTIKSYRPNPSLHGPQSE